MKLPNVDATKASLDQAVKHLNYCVFGQDTRPCDENEQALLLACERVEKACDDLAEAVHANRYEMLRLRAVKANRYGKGEKATALRQS